MVWGCFASDTVMNLFRIQGTLSQHGYHSILQRYAIPSGLRWVGLLYHLFFNTTMIQHTSKLFKGYLTKKESDGVLHQMTWPPQSSDVNQIEMVWDELDRTAEWRISSHQMLSIWGNSFNTVGKAFQVKLVKRMPRVCKAESRQRVATLKNLKSKIYLVCLTLFWSLHDSLCVIS